MTTLSENTLVRLNMGTLITMVAASWFGVQYIQSYDERISGTETRVSQAEINIEDIEVRMALNAVREDIREVESELRELERLLTTNPDAQTIKIVEQQKQTLNAAKTQMTAERDCLQQHKNLKLCDR